MLLVLLQLAYLAVFETPEDAARKWNEAASFKGRLSCGRTLCALHQMMTGLMVLYTAVSPTGSACSKTFVEACSSGVFSSALLMLSCQQAGSSLMIPAQCHFVRQDPG